MRMAERPKKVKVSMFSSYRLFNNKEPQKFDADKQSECEDVHANLDERRIDAMADIVNGSDHKDYEYMVRRDEINDNSELTIAILEF